MGRCFQRHVLSTRGVGYRVPLRRRATRPRSALELSEHVVGYEPESPKEGGRSELSSNSGLPVVVEHSIEEVERRVPVEEMKQLASPVKRRLITARGQLLTREGSASDELKRRGFVLHEVVHPVWKVHLKFAVCEAVDLDLDEHLRIAGR